MCGVEEMAVTRTGSGLILSLGTASGQVFVAAITTTGRDKMVWCALDAENSGKRRVKRLDSGS